MKKTLAIIQIALSYLILWPHILLFLFCSEEKRNAIHADTRKINDKMSVRFNGLNAVIYVIIRDKFYRKLFYHRLGDVSRLVSWYFPGENTFYPICKHIGDGVYLAHPVSTFLNAKRIGVNFSCRQNTTVGNKKEGDNDSLPTIGDNVSLGANVCVIGSVTIGNNVVIGAGSVVVKDIPDNCVAVGNPARVISHEA